MKSVIFRSMRHLITPVAFRLIKQFTPCGSRDDAVVRALASHQCDPGSIPGLDAICGLSLLLVLVPVPRVFLRVLRFSSLRIN